jgi:hypothetical protein
MGSGFKTILLGFPLYYLDTADARQLMKYVMTEKFTHPVGIATTETTGKFPEFVNYPNPFTYETTLAFSLDQSSDVNLTIFNMQGKEVSVLLNRRFEKGINTIKFASGNLPSGVYQAVLHTPTTVLARKILLIR